MIAPASLDNLLSVGEVSRIEDGMTIVFKGASGATNGIRGEDILGRTCCGDPGAKGQRS